MHWQAKGTDYLSRVAWLVGIPLDKFMLDNTEAVKDLDAPLAGVNLLLCGPKPGEGGREGPWGQRGGGGSSINADRFLALSSMPLDVTAHQSTSAHQQNKQTNNCTPINE
jgi:hypothetical protein